MLRRQLVNASMNGDLENVKRIVSSFKNPGSLNIAFIEAAKKGHLPIVKFLSTLPEMSHLTSRDFSYLYTQVSALGHLPVLEFLTQLSRSHNSHLPNSHLPKLEALDVASGFGELPVVKFLTAEEHLTEVVIESAIQIAAERGKLPVVMYLASLLETDDFSDAINGAIEYKRYDIVAFLLGIKAQDNWNLVPSPGRRWQPPVRRSTDDPILNGLLAAAGLIDDQAVPKKFIQEGNKLIMEMQAKYLAPRILDICISLRDQPLPHLVEILDNSLKHADEIPYHLKSNMMEDCKHFGEGKKQKRKTYKL